VMVWFSLKDLVVNVVVYKLVGICAKWVQKKSKVFGFHMYAFIEVLRQKL